MSGQPQSCCLTGFKWNGTPTGRVGKLASNDTYIAGNNNDAAILLIHDLLGWTFPNTRLIADHFATEIDATVYVPDFFDGEVVDFEAVCAERFDEIDLPGMLARHGREAREGEILECTRALKEKYKKVGAIGYCYGGWATFVIAAKVGVDAAIVGHPSLLTKEDVDALMKGEGAKVPLQILAPEVDPVFNKEMKMYVFEKMIERGGAFEYRHFPGVAHACFTRGDEGREGEREALVRGKGAAVGWFREWLKDM